MNYLKLLFILALTPKEFTFSLGFLAFSPFRLALIIFAPIIIFTILKKRKFSWCLADTLIVAISIWPSIALAFNTSIFSGIESGGIIFLEIFIPYFLTRQTITSYEKLKEFSKLVLYLIAFLTLLAIPEAITGKPHIRDLLGSLTGSSYYFEPQNRLGIWRSRSIVDHPIIHGTICSLGFGLSIALISRHLKYFAYAAFSIVGVITSVSSGPLLGLISQVVFITWSKIMKAHHYKWLILAFLILIAYILVDIASNRDPFRVMFSYLLFSTHNGYVRYYMWINSFYVINQDIFSIIFGFGFSTDQFDLIESFFFSNLMKKSVDSFWLINLIRYGWPMFIFLIFLVFSVIRQNISQTFKVRKLKSQKNLLEGWLIITLGITLISFTVHFWSSMVSIFCIVLACSCTSLSTKDIKRSKST